MMTKAERIEAALNLEKPDHVPFAPFIGGYSATFLGKTQAEYYKTPETEILMIGEFFDACGGWDGLVPNAMVSNELVHMLGLKFPVQIKYPGVDLPDNYGMQTHEGEFIKFGDYDKIIEEGYNAYYFDDLVYRLYNLEKGGLDAKVRHMQKCVALVESEWGKRDVKFVYGAGAVHPFFKLSLGRSMIRFTEDLFYKPDVVEKAMDRMTDELIEEILEGINNTGNKHLFLVEERAPAYLYPLHIFERFWMPFTERIVDAMWSNGIRTTFHIDMDWSKNLPYFRKLPAKSVCLQLDSTTDIFNAKKEVGDHCCIMGDVPATMLSIGTPQEVEDYCKELVREVGYNGGFILSTGCECPIDCKKENFLKMCEVAENSHKL